MTPVTPPEREIMRPGGRPTFVPDHPVSRMAALGTTEPVMADQAMRTPPAEGMEAGAREVLEAHGLSIMGGQLLPAWRSSISIPEAVNAAMIAVATTARADGVREERERAAAFLDREAVGYRGAQSCAPTDRDKLYRMGQKDALLLAAAAIRKGDHHE